MKNTIIYEFTGDITPYSVPFIILCVFFLTAIIYALKVWKTSGKGGKIGLVIAPTLISIILLSQITTFFQTKQIINNFASGQCEFVEGIIYDYEQKYKVGTMSEEDYPDRFFVNNTEFVVFGYQKYGIEYCQRKADGGKLENGQNVQIYYTNFKYENLILRIELIADKKHKY